MADLHGSLVLGTLDMLILKALVVEPMHGWGIGQRLEAMSEAVFRVPQGSLYPAFIRLQQRGWIRSEWRITENNRRARYYHITASGRRHLERQREQWRRAVAGVELILAFAH